MHALEIVISILFYGFGNTLFYRRDNTILFKYICYVYSFTLIEEVPILGSHYIHCS